MSEITSGRNDAQDAGGDALDQFAAWLADRGYSSATCRGRLMFVAGLLRWMAAHGVRISALDEKVLGVALLQRRRPGSIELRRSLFHFLEYLRDRGIAAPASPPDDSSPASQIERRYIRYLYEERGVVETTVVNYCGLVRPLVIRWLRAPRADFRRMDSQDVTRFLLSQVPSMAPKRAQLLGSALRSFLRFLFLEAETQVDLSLAVAQVRQFRRASAPKHIASRDVERIIATCDLRTAKGRRDRAILLLLARLGLRASEVVKLELDDVRWRDGELVIRGKGQLIDRLPLPRDVGEALARYFKRDRVSCSSRRAFLRIRAPRRGFVDAAAVTTIVARAVGRSGLRPPHRGAHLLRHSLATSMIRRGATLGEIGQLLRHRSPATTEIYAKVDFDGLRSVALPWPVPGGRR